MKRRKKSGKDDKKRINFKSERSHFQNKQEIFFPVKKKTKRDKKVHNTLY